MLEGELVGLLHLRGIVADASGAQDLELPPTPLDGVKAEGVPISVPHNGVVGLGRHETPGTTTPCFEEKTFRPLH